MDKRYLSFLTLCVREALPPWERGEALITNVWPLFLRLLAAVVVLSGATSWAYLPQVPALVLALAAVLVILRVPYQLWVQERSRVEELEQARQPSIEVSPEVVRGSIARLGTTRAFLRVRNVGTEALCSCYGRISRLICAMEMTINGEKQVEHLRLFNDRDIYLSWQGTAQRYHSFHSEAILEVMRADSGAGGGSWSAHQDTPAPHPVHYFEDYYLAVELAADNAPGQLEHFRLRLYSKSYKDGDRTVLEPIGTAPHVDFEGITEQSIPDAEAPPLS